MKAKHQDYEFGTKYSLELDIPANNLLGRLREVHPNTQVQVNLCEKDAEGTVCVSEQDHMTFAKTAQTVEKWMKEKGIGASDVTIIDTTDQNFFKDVEFNI